MEDYLNTLEFIKQVGDVGEAKTVFRNHIERKETTVPLEVCICHLFHLE